jgi:hypothetical protein
VSFLASLKTVVLQIAAIVAGFVFSVILMFAHSYAIIRRLSNPGYTTEPIGWQNSPPMG